nr:MAG TPA: hypothetical protein [Caudoviricetes sp.]
MLLYWVVSGMMALIVEHGILIGIVPPLIAIGISAVTYYMCIKQLSSVLP